MADSGFVNNNFSVTPLDLIGRPFGLTKVESQFNYCFSRMRVKIEIAIGVLKQRFQILKKKTSYDLGKVNKIFMVCCVLHNFLLNNGEPLPYGSMNDILQNSTNNLNEA